MSAIATLFVLTTFVVGGALLGYFLANRGDGCDDCCTGHDYVRVLWSSIGESGEMAENLRPKFNPHTNTLYLNRRVRKRCQRCGDNKWGWERAVSVELSKNYDPERGKKLMITDTDNHYDSQNLERE